MWESRQHYKHVIDLDGMTYATIENLTRTMTLNMRDNSHFQVNWSTKPSYMRRQWNTSIYFKLVSYRLEMNKKINIKSLGFFGIVVYVTCKDINDWMYTSDAYLKQTCAAEATCESIPIHECYNVWNVFLHTQRRSSHLKSQASVSELVRVFGIWWAATELWSSDLFSWTTYILMY
jgi:hypothetical protein